MRRGGANLNLSMLTEALKTDELVFSLVRILEEPEISADMDSYRLECETIPEGDPCALDLSVNPAIQSPVLKDQIWIALFSKNINQGFLVQPLVGVMAKIHPKVGKEGDTALFSQTGKKLYLTHGTDGEGEDEVLVLGNELKSLLKEIMGAVKTLANNFNTHVHATAAPGPPVPPAPPSTVPATVALLEADVKIDKILSDFVRIRKNRTGV